MTQTIAAIIIGRNEGERLVRGLASVQGVERVIYVDSGSTDGSQEAASTVGSEVVSLDMSRPFTAARARNAGLDRVRNSGSRPTFVQFMDGDCELQPGWLASATAALNEDPSLGVVFGRRRERFPDATMYNRFCDWEWDVPVGQVRSCGGDALMRMDALDAVEGYNPGLIAGEEPEMCVRLRAAGWTIQRIDHEMTLHDAAMTRFGQFWSRARRAGHAWAEGAALHGARPERHCVPETRKALIWGFGIPLSIFALALVIGPTGLLFFCVYPARAIRFGLREGGTTEAWERAFLLSSGKFPEALGVLEYHTRRLIRRPRGLIEYK